MFSSLLLSKPDEAERYMEVLKSMYGEKLAPSAWFDTLSDYLTRAGFQPAGHELAVWFRKDGCVVFSHVDDIVILAPTRAMRENFYKELSEEFDVTPMQCMEDSSRDEPITHLAHDLFMEDGDLITSLACYLEGAGNSAEVTLGKPLRHRTKLPSVDALEEEQDGYIPLDEEGIRTLRSIVGLSGYAISSLRGDGAVAHGAAGQGLSLGKGDSRHMKIAVELIEYLVSTKHREMRWVLENRDACASDRLSLVAFWDSNFGTQKARSGGVIQVSGLTVSQISKRQATTSQSSTEAELISGSQIAREAVGIMNLLAQVFHTDDDKCSLAMMGDNHATVSMVGGQSNVRKVRHLSLADLFLRELIRDDPRVTVRWISGEENPSDMLTKILRGDVLEGHLTSIGYSFFYDKV